MLKGVIEAVLAATRLVLSPLCFMMAYSLFERTRENVPSPVLVIFCRA